MSWLRVIIDAHRDEADTVEQVLTDSGALSVSLEDRQDEPMFEYAPGDMPLWSETRLTGLYAAGTDTTAIIDQVTDTLGHTPIQTAVEEMIDQDWERVWLERFQPIEVGRGLWICPTQMDPPEPQAVTVFIDPGLAFGSGTHPTTAMCLDWLSRHDLSGKNVLDYGCGSGILAIAALKLGAATALATDIDPQALTVTTDNARLNGVEANLATCLPDKVTGQFDVVVANILSGPLVELADTLSGYVKAGGHLVLSGILESQTQDILAAYGGRFALAVTERDGWIRADGANVET